jgi:beta-phosphoglucomutase-like phosphatase (HAD superfamily)
MHLDGVKHLKGVAGVSYDWDGTIVLTGPIHASGWTYACQQVAGVTPTPEMLQRQKGMGGLEAATMMLPPDLAHLAPTIQQKKKQYVKEHLGDLSIAPGFPEAYHELRSRGIAFGIFTASDRDLFDKMLDAVPDLRGLEHFLDILVTKEDFKRGKPKPDGLYVCFGRMGVSLEDGMYVGDGLNDYLAAVAARTRFAYFMEDMDAPLPPQLLKENLQRIHRTKVPAFGDHRLLLLD